MSFLERKTRRNFFIDTFKGAVKYIPAAAAISAACQRPLQPEPNFSATITSLEGTIAANKEEQPIPPPFPKTLPTTQPEKPLPTAQPQILPTAKPAEAPKPAPTVESSLKPEELYRKLLSAQIDQNDLPPGFVPKGNQAGNLDQTAKAFSAVGQANILLSDNDPRLAGQPNAGLTYVIFPKPSDAKGAFEAFKAQSTKTPQGFDYPAVFATVDLFGGAKINVCSVLFDNVFVDGMFTTVSSTGLGNIVAEDKTIALAKTGLKHLQKIKNPSAQPLTAKPAVTPKPTAAPLREQPPQVEWKTLTQRTEDQRIQYSINYSSDWSINANTGDSFLIVTPARSSVIMESTTYYPDVDLSNNKGLKTYTEMEIVKLNRFGDVFELSPAKAGSYSAYWIKAKIDGMNHNVVVFIAGNRAWSMILVTTPTTTEKELPKFQRMVDSFKIL